MPEKLKPGEYERYWRRVHESSKDDLAAVCHPTKPPYFSRFNDWTQRYALRKAVHRKKLALRDVNLLDIGCGGGRWLSFFEHEYGAKALGVDLSYHAVQVCVSRSLIACEGSVTDLPFPSAYFDLVTSITVLLHLPPQTKPDAIQEIARVLKPRGKVILIESTWPDDPSPHVFGLGLEDWCELFAQHHLQLVHRSAHHFNFFRRRWFIPLPTRIRDWVTTLLDYPIEYVLMNYYYEKKSRVGLQHVMIFEKVGMAR
jgi:ubiquinone/menaquinone biosynthesis C-methylase UbiE